MSFKDAIIQAVDNHGREIATQSIFYSILADYGAFRNERECVRKAVKEIVNSKIYNDALSGKIKPEKAVDKISRNVSHGEGLTQEDIRDLTIELFTALGLLTPKKEIELLPKDEKKEHFQKKQNAGKGFDKTGDKSRKRKIIGMVSICFGGIAVIALSLFLILMNRPSDRDSIVRQDKKFNVTCAEGSKTIKTKKIKLAEDSAIVQATARWCDAIILEDGGIELVWDNNPIEKERQATITVSDSKFIGNYIITQSEYTEKGVGGAILKIFLWIVGIIGVIVWVIVKIFE